MSDGSDIRLQLNEIRALEDKYGFIPFRMGLTHLVDVGINNLTDEAVEKGIEQIMAQGEADKANGKRFMMTPNCQCVILRCSAELAKYSPWTLFRYIKENISIDGY